jgi:xylan 1,4-beta-xylosidase
MKKLFIYMALACFYLGIQAQTIEVGHNGVPFTHYWSMGVGAGRVNEALRAGWHEHLKLSHEQCGFQYVRMHGLFHDDMFVYFQKPDGKVVYNWQYIDEVYDRMLSIGVRPFVELAFFPKDIAAPNSKTEFWWKANITVDRNNFGKWHDLVKAFTQHVVDRYGIDEVSKWYFEVWNEPNLANAFLDGTRSDYFQLYKEASLAVKSVNNRLKVGGPATSNFIADSRNDGEVLDNTKSVFFSQEEINKQQWKGIWIEKFLKFCETENLPLDFVSAHPYPTDYALDPITGKGKNAIRYANSLHDDIAWLHKVISESKYPNAEIQLTEWSTSPSSRDAMHDLLPPAAYIIKSSLDNIGSVSSLMYWAFTDIFEEKGAGEEIFHGSFGMINFQGLVKPSFHAYRMLNQLGNEKLYYRNQVFVSKFSQTGKVSILAYNYPKEYDNRVPSAADINSYMNASSKELNMEIKGLTPHATFEMELLDKEHGNVYDAYKEMGSPHSPSIKQIAELKEKAWGVQKTILKSDENGVLIIKKSMEPWACLLIKEQ